MVMLEVQAQQHDIELQDRDLALLHGLFESRLMTLKHVAALCFHSSQEAAKKRVQKLKRAGLVGERSRRPFEPSILFLTSKGFDTLSIQGALSGYPNLTWAAFERRAQVSELTLKHELDILEVKTAITLAIHQRPNFNLVEFSTWPALFEFDSAPGPYEPPRTVKPDGFIRIQEEQSPGSFQEFDFFLEVDRSTEVLERLATQACCYRQYYRNGGLAKRLGKTGPVPFRVLMVFQNAERRNNVADTLLRLAPPIMEQVWLATLGDLRSNALGDIWIRPADYRAVTQNTAFDSEHAPSWPYRRRPVREELVEKSINKLPLLAS